MTQADELAYRTAESAGPFAESLAIDCTQIAHALRAGEVRDALATFEATADRLQRFLTFLVVTSELLGQRAPELGVVVADYGRRVLRLVARIEHTLVTNDLVGVTLTLEHGLGPALAEYSGYAEKILLAFRSRLAA
jgi:hypothetical protein